MHGTETLIRGLGSMYMAAKWARMRGRGRGYDARSSRNTSSSSPLYVTRTDTHCTHTAGGRDDTVTDPDDERVSESSDSYLIVEFAGRDVYCTVYTYKVVLDCARLDDCMGSILHARAPAGWQHTIPNSSSEKTPHKQCVTRHGCTGFRCFEPG